MSTSVIVVSCRKHRWLRPCLESAIAQADEVIVVDNGSSDGWAARLGTELGTKVVRLKRNSGVPAGVNAGIKVATGDVIAILNDDAIADPGWLPQAQEALADPTVAAVGPKLLFAHPFAELQLDDEVWHAPGDPRPLGRALETATVAGLDVLDNLAGRGVHALEEGVRAGMHQRWRWTAGDQAFYVPLPDGASPEDIRINAEPVECRRIVDLVNNAGSYLSREGHAGDYGFETPDHEQFDIPGDRFAVCGAALVTTAEAIRRIGTLASSFFAYYEDTDWCWRAQLAGMSVRYMPSGVVRHVGGVSTGGVFDAGVQFLAARNRLHCLARNAPLPLLRWQVRRAREPGQPEGLERALATRLPRGLVERRYLARHWERSPHEVFDRWAGVGETWPQCDSRGLEDQTS